MLLYNSNIINYKIKIKNTGNKYHLQKIGKIQKQLEAEKEKRMRLGKKYKKGVKAANVIDYILATLIMGLSVLGKQHRTHTADREHCFQHQLQPEIEEHLNRWSPAGVCSLVTECVNDCIYKAATEVTVIYSLRMAQTKNTIRKQTNRNDRCNSRAKSNGFTVMFSM